VSHRPPRKKIMAKAFNDFDAVMVPFSTTPELYQIG